MAEENSKKKKDEGPGFYRNQGEIVYVVFSEAQKRRALESTEKFEIGVKEVFDVPTKYLKANQEIKSYITFTGISAELVQFAKYVSAVEQIASSWNPS